MRMCSTLALISCNAALRGRMEGCIRNAAFGGRRDGVEGRYVCGEGIESGTVGSRAGEERGGRC